ncbi:MAG: FAD-binding oxidoreductase [Anaerolineaceae bacterium]|nr:FAD-binding oxidoreductase [Anaerolineaceae bacterium]
MSDRRNYDVIIIGAGSVGAPAAFYMAQAGLKVLVLESVHSVGQGSNKRAIGGIRATHSDPAKIRLCRRSIEIFSTYKETYGIDIEWDACGYSYVAYTPREEKILKDLLPIHQKAGIKNDWYSADSYRKLVPDINPQGLLGGTFSPDDGSASPLLANHAFFIKAQELGAEFHFNEPVRQILCSGNKVSAVVTNQATYSCAILLNAAGAWASDIGKLAGLDLPVRPDSHEAAITEAVARFLGPMIVDIRPAAGSSNYYFYQHVTGQIIFCITPDPNAWGTNINETSSFLPMVAKRMVEVMPRLSNIRVRRTWRGLYPMTPDGFPIIGWAPQLENFLLGVGFCGQGFMLGPASGELLTRIALHQTTPADVEILPLVAPNRTFSGQELLK